MGPKRSIETNISKKGYLPFQLQKILASFSRTIDCEEPRRLLPKGPQGFLTTIVQMRRSFHSDLRDR